MSTEPRGQPEDQAGTSSDLEATPTLTPSSRRERILSCVNTLRRCHSTVRGLRKSRAPISGFGCPWPAFSAICRSCAVQVVAHLDDPLPRSLARRQRVIMSALGERVRPNRGEVLRGRPAPDLVRPSDGSRAVTTLRKDHPPPYRSGRATSGPRRVRVSHRSPRVLSLGGFPSLSKARERASMPSAQSVGCDGRRRRCARTPLAALAGRSSRPPRSARWPAKRRRTAPVHRRWPRPPPSALLVAPQTIKQNRIRIERVLDGRALPPGMHRAIVESISARRRPRGPKVRTTSAPYCAVGVPWPPSRRRPQRSVTPPSRTLP